MITDKTIDAVAREVCKADMVMPDELSLGSGKPRWTQYTRQAKAAIQALLDSGEVTANQWQPIETAPKDGSTVFVWTGNAKFSERIEAAWRLPTDSEMWVSGTDYEPSLEHGTFNYEAGWFSQEGYEKKFQGDESPTHWMPLPQPPKKD